MSGEDWNHSINNKAKPQAEMRAAVGRIRADVQRTLDQNFEAFKQEAFRSLALVYRLR